MTTTTIDGSHGEGGGQILRNACAYAAILRKNVRIVNIRAGRKKPGLRPQHLVGLRLLAAASGGCLVEGNHVGSTEILFLVDNNNETNNNNASNSNSNSSTTKNSNTTNNFHGNNNNGRTKNREYIGDTQTAGSVCLLLQTVLPFALLRNKDHDNNDDESLRFILKGGTDADFAPPIDYFRYVFLPTLRNCCGLGGRESGINNEEEEENKQVINLEMIGRGFFPRGGGEVRVTVRRPSLTTLPLPPIRLTERGKIIGITVRAFSAGNCPPSMAKTLSTTVQNIISSNPSYNAVPTTVILSEESETSSSNDTTTSATTGGKKRGNKRPRPASSGCGVLIVAETDTGCLFGGSATGSPKIPLIETARAATKEVVDAMDGGGCVDDYLQDQLILYMALADGVSELVTNSFTLHTRTAIWLASRMVPSARFEVTKLQVAEDTSSIDDDGDMGGRIPVRHRIRCHGIGLCPSRGT